jgi:hypothetical protein
MIPIANMQAFISGHRGAGLLLSVCAVEGVGLESSAWGLLALFGMLRPGPPRSKRLD